MTPASSSRPWPGFPIGSQVDTLRLTGKARVDWDPESAKACPGALRVVEFEVDAVVQIDQASSLRWEFVDYSRFNPPAH